MESLLKCFYIERLGNILSGNVLMFLMYPITKKSMFSKEKDMIAKISTNDAEAIRFNEFIWEEKILKFYKCID